MDCENPTPPVKRTVIVLDHSSKFLAFSKQHIDFDSGGKKSKGKSSGTSSGLSPVFKSSWTCIIEAAVEYCRIVYDIFPNEYLVSEKGKISAHVHPHTLIDHAFYSCGRVTRPMNGSEAAGDLVLIQTSLLFFCKCRLVSITT